MAQRVAPDARVVYVDHDPVVVNHGKALLASRDGTTDIVQADLRDTATITGKAGKTLDFGQPVGHVGIARKN